VSISALRKDGVRAPFIGANISAFYVRVGPIVSLPGLTGQMCKRFTYDDAERFANRDDGGRERETILDGISTLQKALAEAGFAPR
jgi:hypothetical protein